MAEEKKKDDKKDAGKPASGDPATEIIALLVALAFITIIFQQIYSYINNSGTFDIFWNKFSDNFLEVWTNIKFISAFLSVSGVVWLIYSIIKLLNLTKEEDKIYSVIPENEPIIPLTPYKNENEKWKIVEKHINSENPSDWRLAIIEADIMLEDLLKANGYDGNGVGEMLKQVEASDMLTLDLAWEAHKVRNRIAHAGSDYDLNEREAKRVVSLFESVFKEYKII